jgi:hypothetical protein
VAAQRLPPSGVERGGAVGEAAVITVVTDADPPEERFPEVKRRSAMRRSRRLRQRLESPAEPGLLSEYFRRELGPSEDLGGELGFPQRAWESAEWSSEGVDPGALASALARRLTDLVPESLTVTVQAGSDVWIRSDRGHGVVCEVARFACTGGSVAERVCAAATQALECASGDDHRRDEATLAGARRSGRCRCRQRYDSPLVRPPTRADSRASRYPARPNSPAGRLP